MLRRVWLNLYYLQTQKLQLLSPPGRVPGRARNTAQSCSLVTEPPGRGKAAQGGAGPRLPPPARCQGSSAQHLSKGFTSQPSHSLRPFHQVPLTFSSLRKQCGRSRAYKQSQRSQTTDHTLRIPLTQKRQRHRDGKWMRGWGRGERDQWHSVWNPHGHGNAPTPTCADGSTTWQRLRTPAEAHTCDRRVLGVELRPSEVQEKEKQAKAEEEHAPWEHLAPHSLPT